MEEHISKGYLYTLWGDQLSVKEGAVMRNQWCSQREAIFRFSTRDGDWVACSPKPAKVVKAKLWLPERDDTLGCRLLTEYYESCVRILQGKITKYEEKIRLLSDMNA